VGQCSRSVCSTRAWESWPRLTVCVSVPIGEYNFIGPDPKRFIVGHNATIRSRGRNICAWQLATALVIVVGSMKGPAVRAGSQDQSLSEPALSEPLVIQGRITAIEGALVTVKTPDAYPGARGGHAQYVAAGPAFRVDVSRARVLLPDGRRADKAPLAVGDRVVVVLTGPDLSPPGPGAVNQTYSASIVEHLTQSDKIVTH